uniref:BRO-N domain-containing protein n=1 Tax=Paractinoplanes polyasparticus TaxID=2856853 RepID=UPI002105B1E6|nr:BRO family protein [Actinoplanes polyasparticus]
MSTITRAFEFGEHELRTIVIGGDPWFFASDITSALALGNPRSSLALLDEDEKGVHTMDTPGGEQQVTVVNEPGMYSLILRSRKAEARVFKRWVTHEVLPAIRKTGRYEDESRAIVALGAGDDEQRRATAARLDLSVIQAMGGIVDPKWCESLARHTWAVYKGEKPEIAAEDRLLMVQPYLVERGVSKADIASIGSVFGKRVKAAYVAEYNREPEEVPALLNGRERPVKGYYERDRFLFDAVFDEYYTHLVGPQQLELGAA